MQSGDFARFRAVMAGMAELYQRELSNTLLDVYWLTLKDWGLDEFERAAGSLMATGTFMPRPADFTALRKKAQESTAAEAWFTKGVSQDKRANHAMRIATQGRYVGHVPLDELPWVQKRFMEAYAELADVAEAREALPGPDWLQLQARTAGALRKL